MIGIFFKQLKNNIYQQFNTQTYTQANDFFCGKYKCLIFSQCLWVGLKAAVIFSSVMSVVYQHCSIMFILMCVDVDVYTRILCSLFTPATKKKIVKYVSTQ